MVECRNAVIVCDLGVAGPTSNPVQRFFLLQMNSNWIIIFQSSAIFLANWADAMHEIIIVWKFIPVYGY